MNEALDTANVREDLVPHVAPSAEIEYTGSVHQDGLLWFVFSSPRENTHLLDADLALLEKIQEELQVASNRDFESNGQSKQHSEVIRFLFTHWSVLLDILKLRRSPEVSRSLINEKLYPEVFIPCPYFNAPGGHSLDCIGNDRYGHLYVFEVGRGNKISQLNKQLHLVRTVFPDVPVTGAVVKYKPLSQQARRLSFQFI